MTTKELAKKMFDIHQNVGLPRELIVEQVKKNWPDLSEEIMSLYDQFDKEHREISRRSVGKKFGLNKS